MRRWMKRLGLVCGGVFLLWFPVTWFFFGSVHPCGILSQRMLPKIREHASASAAFGLAISAQSLSEMPDVESEVESAIEGMIRSTYRLAPSKCLWRAVIWSWDPKADEYYQKLIQMTRDALRR